MPHPASAEGALPEEYEQALRDMAQILAHRLRGLVASIEGFADLLTDTLGTHEQRELALRIFEGAARIEHVLADLQLYSEPIAPVTVPLRASDLLCELEAMLDEPAFARIRMEAAVAEDCLLFIDPRLLRQALLVLLQNALEARKEGAVLLRVTQEEGAGCLAVEVWNEGGIPLEDADTLVFRPFFTTKAQNLGVGLTLARRIVEAHAGMLYLATNDPVEGTCFRLSVPASEEPSSRTSDPPEPAAA